MDDAEYSIPAIDKLPTLESILTEQDSEQSPPDLSINEISSSSSDLLNGSETTSVGSLLSLNSLTRQIPLKNPEIPLSGIILKHAIMRGITSQLNSAIEKVNSGFGSSICASNEMIVIGTSHGLLLAFDTKQTLRWCNQDYKNQGAVSSLCFNNDSTRLLAGYARGNIIMIDCTNGKILRTLTDVHQPGTAVLHVKFTDSPKLALCSDSGGSVFELNFTRVMGVRGCDSKCLFSGSRGEVCTIEPLLLNTLPRHPLKNYTLIGLATLSRVLVVCIRPRTRIILTHPLTGPSTTSPQISWQLVVIQTSDATRIIDPVLAIARDKIIHFYQVCTEAGSRIKLSPLRKMSLSYTINNLHWLNTRTLTVVDINERLHLIEVRTQEELEIIDMSPVGISYSSSYFKGLSTGGNVSKAMGLAGERACYNTIITYGNQLLILGTKRLHVVFIRSWSERLRYLTLQKRYKDALSLGLSFYKDKGKAVVGLSGMKKVRKRLTFIKTSEILLQYLHEYINTPNDYLNDDNNNNIISICVDYAVQLDNTHLLFGTIWDMIYDINELKINYLHSLEGPILDGSLPPRLPPIIIQEFVKLYEKEKRFDALQSIIIILDVDCLDIHQVTTICRLNYLWDALIHLQISTLGDYSAPIHQLIPILNNSFDDDDNNNNNYIKLGNTLLVYASCCLAGRGFPRGDLPKGQSQRAKAEVLRALLSQHTSLAEDNERQYPYLRTLLRFDTRGFIDVISMAFQENEFKNEMGLRQRQRIIDIMLNIVMPTTPLTPDSHDYINNIKKSMVLVFIGNEVSMGFITLEPLTLNRLVEFICTDNYLNITNDEKLERENTIIELINSKKLNSITDNTLLKLSHKANFLRVSEIIYTAKDDWIAVCHCIINDYYRKNDVWSWLDKLTINSFTIVVFNHIKNLIDIDSDKISTIITSRMSNKINQLIEIVNDNIEREYLFLSSLYNISQFKEDDDTKFELTTNLLERYLYIMCKIKPDNVINHINGSHGCRLDEALNIIKNSGLKNAEALMLEKMGNYQDAFNLLIDNLENSLNMYYQNKLSCNDVEKSTIEISSLCKRSAGHLDWMPLVEIVLQSNHANDDDDNDGEIVKLLRGKLLKIVLEELSGTDALSYVLEKILKHPLATSGTIGDIRQLLTDVLMHSRYEQVLVETTVRLISLELHEALEKTLR